MTEYHHPGSMSNDALARYIDQLRCTIRALGVGQYVNVLEQALEEQRHRASRLADLTEEQLVQSIDERLRECGFRVVKCDERT